MRADLPDPANAPELFEGILIRRVMAFCIDMLIVFGLLVAASIATAIAGVFSFGLLWLLFPFVVPAVVVLYYAATLGSTHRATLGMQSMDIVLTPTRGAPLDGWKAFLHTFVFWITFWYLWPISLLVALFTPRRELLHDLIVGTLMVRKSPMARHWAEYARDGTAGGTRS
ncbi:MAG TPA: RDD family protein [Devosiaceae bacterium]